MVRAAHTDELSTICVRPHLIIGPGDPLLTEAMLQGACPPPLIGQGHNTITPTYVKNIAGLIAQLPARLTEEALGGSRRLGGTVLSVGDAHVSGRELRSLLLSCRSAAPSVLAPSRLPLWLCWMLPAQSCCLPRNAISESFKSATLGFLLLDGGILKDRVVKGVWKNKFKPHHEFKF